MSKETVKKYNGSTRRNYLSERCSSKARGEGKSDSAFQQRIMPRRFQYPENQSGFSNYSFQMLAVPPQNIIMPMACDTSLLKVRLNLFPDVLKEKAPRPHTDHEISLPKTKLQSMKHTLEKRILTFIKRGPRIQCQKTNHDHMQLILQLSVL